MLTHEVQRPRRTAHAAASSLARSMCLAGALLLGTSGAVVGQMAGEGVAPGVIERFAFDAADTDGDGLINEAEFARDAAAGFSGLDTDRSETLTPDELGPHDPAQFARVDRNGDGALTFSEVMTYKMRGFEEADADGDGMLSFEEMVDGVEAELGVQ